MSTPCPPGHWARKNRPDGAKSRVRDVRPVSGRTRSPRNTTTCCGVDTFCVRVDIVAGSILTCQRTAAQRPRWKPRPSYTNVWFLSSHFRAEAARFYPRVPRASPPMVHERQDAKRPSRPKRHGRQGVWRVGGHRAHRLGAARSSLLPSFLPVFLIHRFRLRASASSRPPRFVLRHTGKAVPIKGDTLSLGMGTGRPDNADIQGFTGQGPMPSHSRPWTAPEAPGRDRSDRPSAVATGIRAPLGSGGVGFRVAP